MDNDSVPNFTLEEYIEYLKAPQWVKDGFDSEAAYHAELSAKVKAWADNSDDHFKLEKDVWEICYDQIENTSKKQAKAGAIGEDLIAQSRIPVLKNTMLDEVASVYSGQFAPVLKPLSEPVQPMVALANQYMKVEFILNNWDGLKYDLGLDGFVTDLWVLKIYTDNSEPGPFGEEYAIKLDRIDPLNCCWDPNAKRLKWSDMDYFIVKDELDVGVARKQFPDMAGLIDLSIAEPAGNTAVRGSELTTVNRRWASFSERLKVKIKECWLHDERMKFRAHEEFGADGEKQVKVDPETGYVVGTWEAAYPYGRMIVTAADKIVLRDTPNPYWHKGLPFVFCQMSPTTRLISIGKAASILGIDRKVNDIESRVHAYAQSEIERPMQAEMGALPSNIAWYKTTGQSRNILVLQPNKQFVRPQPVEVPAFLLPYLGRLNQYKDQTSGQSGIMRGEIPQGANVAQGAVDSIQGAANVRPAMTAVYISQAMKEIGNKMFWLQRETYRTGLSAVIRMPGTNEEIDVEWDHETVGNDFFVDVNLAANTPGGEAQLQQKTVALWREKLVPRSYVLATMGIEGWEQLDKQLRQQELEEITAQAFGRSFGMSLKEVFKKKEDTRGAVKQS